MEQEIEQSIHALIHNQVDGVMSEHTEVLPTTHYPRTEELPNTAEQALVNNAQLRRKLSPRMGRLVLYAGDLLLVIASFAIIVALASRFHISIHMGNSINSGWVTALLWGSLMLAFWKFSANMMQAHDLVNASNRFRSVVSALFTLMLTSLFATVITFPFLVGDRDAYIQLSLFFLLIIVPPLVLWRILFVAFSNLSGFRRKAVIVGMNATGIATAAEIQNAKSARVTVLGYISDTSEHQPPQTQALPFIGGRDALRRLAQQGVIDMIVMAVDYHSSPRLFQDAFDVAQLGVSIVPVTSVYELTSGKVPVEHMGDQWYISLPAEAIASPLYLLWQKVLDISFGLLGSAVLLLALPVIATLIYLDSPGPIFYSQERMGYQGRKFRIYKFRSMHVNAESKGQPQWAKARDPRVTRIGAFMRATHLDELPQVFNILRGEMSLVGPRPEREEFVDKLEQVVPFYRCRLSVKPGLTGWAQVKYRYGNTDQDALIKMQYDLYYIKHRSFMLDIFIMLNTVIEVLFRQGI